MTSVTVVDGGRDDDEWGENSEEEVVIWSHDIRTAAVDDGRDVSRRGFDSHPRGLLVASLANLAISYNVVNIGLALKLMAETYPEASSTDESLVSAGAILGMMVGQVLFGAAGDCMGRQLALCCTLFVCFLGAVGSALLTFEHGFGGADIFKQLLYWRILLGVGAGGVYPLAATLARASNVDWFVRFSGAVGASVGGSGEEGGSYPDTGSTAVALMFSTQGMGYLAAHVTGVCLLCVLPESSPLAWRLLLGLGAVLPLALIVMLLLAFARAQRYGLVRSTQDVDPEGAVGAVAAGSFRGSRGSSGGNGDRPNAVRVWLSMRDKHELVPKLLGTAGSWFLFDVTFYGNQLYEEDVLQRVFGQAEGLRQVAVQDSIVALVALPGYFVAVALIGRLGPRYIQVQGFLVMGVIFATIGIAFDFLRQHDSALMGLYSLTFFFSNFGPNSTTFMLPSLTFPDQVRGSLNGISAAAGKFGALIGGLVFKPAAQAFGVRAIFIVCALVSLAGGALTLAFVHDNEQKPAVIAAVDTDDEREESLELSRTPRALADGRSRAASTTNDGMTEQLSPGSSRENTPINTKRKGSGKYSIVGGGAADSDDGNGTFGDSVFARGHDGMLANGGRENEGFALGRKGDVEGQVESGSASGRWDGQSDSDSQDGTQEEQ